MRPLVNNQSDKQIAATTFFGKSYPGDSCGSNGLPLTPNSISILGRAQYLKDLRHDNICQYLDIIRTKHERTIVVSEYIGTSLEQQTPLLDKVFIARVMYQIAHALDYLFENNIIVHNLEPKHILLDDYRNVKLFNYGLYYMTNEGAHVPFPIGNIRYMAPECSLNSNNNIKSDIWSLGIIIAELLLEVPLWFNLKISSISRKILSFCQSNNVFEKIAREHNRLEVYYRLDPQLRDLVEKCLSVNPVNRPMPKYLIDHDYFIQNINKYSLSQPKKPQNLLLRCPLDQVYHFWQLAGGDVLSDLKKEGLIRSEAPILAMPQIVCMNGAIVGPKRSQSYLMDDRIVFLKLDILLQRLKKLPPSAYFPLIHSQQLNYSFGYSMDQLPLIIRERDIEYQFYRVRLFDRLLKGYPYTRDLILKQAAIDIPPLLRGKIWSCILDVIPNQSYSKIDKYTPTYTDRQIEVDIPRCHQYDELLSSPVCHQKLKRLLKAWVTAHPQYVYWQGLDSLTAPFLKLNINNEELAFLSLFSFIPKYLHLFFLKDNTAVIKEYLSKFSQLTAFLEPLLAQHLANINFIPELFAIPWFLTMFSHVFPLHKIMHLWDKLMLGDHSYPLFIGISILKQLKTTLLSSGFNECILLFSDLPDIVMEICVQESQKMYEMTPKSITHRKTVNTQQSFNEFDIVPEIPLTILQKEVCPRISANDFINLLKNNPNTVVALDLRGVLEYGRVRLPESINIPFSTVQLGVHRIESLNVPNLDMMLRDRFVVCISNIHENSVEFSKFLISCGVARVCVLHNGFNILHSYEPNILICN